MSINTNEVVIEKLRKIQAVIEDAKNDHEAQVAMMMFQRLLDKNGLTESDVDAYHVEDETVNEVEVFTASRVATWKKLLHAYIARHFRCLPLTREYVTPRGKIYKRVFVGMGNDPEIATATYNAAVNVANASWERYIDWVRRKRPGMSIHNGIRSQFYQAFADGLDKAYTEQEAALNMSLILVRDKRVDAYTVEQGFERKSIQIKSYNDGSGARSEGFKNGYQHGKGRSLTDGQRSIEGGK